MPITLGNTSISGLGVGGLPANSVTTDNIANSAVTRAKIGYSGAVLQVVQANNTTASTHTNTNTDCVAVTITPTSATSKIYIHANAYFHHDNGNGYFTITRNNTIVGNAIKHPVNDAAPDGNAYQDTTRNQQYEMETATMDVFDSPNSTSALTYRIRYNHVVQNGGTLFLNRGRLQSGTGTTSIVVMEIKG
jgi:hypothetical protein